MRYVYIICLLLSSFFTYKYATATSKAQQYAFFMPNNAFEQNTNVQNINNMQPRYNHNETASKNYSSSKSSSPKITLPYVKKEIKVVKPAQQSSAPSKSVNKVNTATPQPVISKTPEPKKAPVLTEEVQKKLQQYSLEEKDDSLALTSNSSTDSDNSNQPETKSITQILEDMPYPDRSQPKFKQLYARYITELRVLHRHGELPKNNEQQKTLAKASDFHRFIVE